MSEIKEKSVDREQAILDAALTLLSQHGISGVSMRAVAKAAGVSLGLVHYYYSNKVALMAAVLRRIEEEDIALVRANPGQSPDENLKASLRRTSSARYLTTEYLSLRLQLWALAQADPTYEQINIDAQKRYRQGLAELIAAARPELAPTEVNRRAIDIDIIQNGIWLTALLGITRSSAKRCIQMCEDIAFG